MATFTEVYKQELKNKGVLSSIGSATLKRARERLDIRNALFGGEGFIASTGQKIFGKGYKAIQKTPGASKISEGGQLQSEALNMLLQSSQRQEAHLQQIGKNTMSMRGMARDMNVMRQNIIKLLKVFGAKGTNKADAFFLSQKEEEAAYENRVSKKTSPTPLSSKTTDKKKDGGGILGLLGKAASGVFGVVKTLVGAIGSIGSVIASAIGSGLSGLISILGGVSTALGPLLGLAKEGLKIVFNAGGKVLTGALSLGARGIAAFLRMALPFLMSPAGLAILGTAGIAWMILKLMEDEYAEPRPQNELDTMAENQRAIEEAKGTKAREIMERYQNLHMRMRNMSGQARENAQKELDSMAGELSALGYDVSEAQLSGQKHPQAVFSKRSAGDLMNMPEPGGPGPTKVDIRSIDNEIDKKASQLPSGGFGLPFDYDTFASTLGKRESGSDYKKYRDPAFAGKYQMGSMALEDVGLVKKGSSQGKNIRLDDPSIWEIPGGVQSFLNNGELQEKAMKAMTQKNYAQLRRMNIITDTTPREDVAGYLTSAHLGGPGGVKAMLSGNVRKDYLGTSTLDYFRLGQAAQKGENLNSASVSRADMISIMRMNPSSTPVVVAPSNNVQNNQSINMRPIVQNNQWRDWNSLLNSPAQ